jgi:ribosomal-protein-alanine N-acetyltransferase
MSEVNLREYRTGDWEAMYALDVICFEPPFRFSRRAMRRFAEADNAVTVLAEVEEKLAGFCVAHLEEQVAYVVTVDVQPEWRRRGLAARLMTETEVRARSLGAQSMALHVFTGNSGAIRFYERLAYEQIGMAEGFYGQNLNALVYVKRLGV